MQIEAIWKNGALHPKRPLAFKRSEVSIEVPDSEVLEIEGDRESGRQPASTQGEESILLNELRQILGPLYRERPARSVKQDREEYIEALTEKYKK